MRENGEGQKEEQRTRSRSREEQGCVKEHKGGSPSAQLGQPRGGGWNSRDDTRGVARSQASSILPCILHLESWVLTLFESAAEAAKGGAPQQPTTKNSKRQ
jgi:hypothetical protein